MLQRFGEAADAEAIERFGFGFADLIEVALRIIATERRVAASAWKGRRPTSAQDAARISDGEIEAARRLLDGWQHTAMVEGFPEILLNVTGGITDVDGDPERLRRLGRAWDYATVDVRGVVPAPLRTSHLITGLAVRSEDSLVPVPAGLVLTGLSAVGVQLVDRLRSDADTGTGEAIVAALEHGAEVALHSSLENLLAHAMPVAIDADNGRCWVVCPSARHLVLVAVVAGLTGRATDGAVERARKSLSRAVSGSLMHCVGAPPPGMAVPQPGTVPVDPSLFVGSGRVSADAAVTRVVLVDGLRPERMRLNRGAVILSVNEWQFLTAQVRDPEELWSFLEELALLPGLDHLEAFEVRDVWTVFRERGVLMDGGVKQRDAFVLPQDLHEEWRTASVLDGVEGMLRGWGFGGVSAWPAQAVGHDGVVSLWSLILHSRLVASPGYGIAVASFDPDRLADHYFADLLVENIHATLRALASAAESDDDAGHMARGWVAWLEASSQRPVLVDLHGTAPEADQDPVRLAVLDEGDRIVVVYDETRLRYLTAGQMHSWLGTALADAVLAMACMSASPPRDGQHVLDSRELADDHPGAAEARDAFLRAWLAVPPALRVFHFQGPSARAVTVFGAARLTEQGRNRAGRSIAEEMVRRAIPAQQATGHSAIALLDKICQAALAAFHRELVGFDGSAALVSAAGEVERIWEVRIRNEPERAMRDGMSAREVAREVNESLAARAGDFLLETLLHDAPTGATRLDHRDWVRLLHLAAECIQLSSHLSAVRCGLLTVDVEVKADGVVRIEHREALMDLSLHQEQRAAANARWIASQVEERPLEPEPGEDNTFQSQRALLQQSIQHPEVRGDERRAELMLAVDDALRAEMGTSLDAINAVLATAAAWHIPGDPVDLTALVLRDELAISAAQWSGLPFDQIEGAFPLLTLSKDMLASEGIRYWSLEGRNARLAIRPLIATADRQLIMILPRRTVGARRVLANYLSDYRLPWPDKLLPKPVVEAQRVWRKARTLDFEVEVEQMFLDNGITHRRRTLVPHKARKAGLEIPGEIDLLAADPRHRVLWVVEAKDQHIPFDPYQLVSEVIDFHGLAKESNAKIAGLHAKIPEDSFVGKLLTKAEMVGAQIDAALRMLDLSAESADGWQVVPLFVTPRPCTAAAVPHPRVAFVTTAGLDALLQDPSLRSAS
jgi:hypothetical protein